MTITFTGFCDALIDDLTTEVPGLRDVHVHRYLAWDPEELLAMTGERHLGVWPLAEAAESALPLVTGPGGDLLIQAYRIVYWESAGNESSRAVGDTQAGADLLALMEAVRARLYAIENVFLGGAEHVRYTGTNLPDRSGQVRWFEIGLQVRTSITVS